ncbi:CHASE domain-containing protein, partial [Sulfuricurvum sp.]|uniref:CHASE domain-containing protein n=1 Tax=Sulfuricurvum sp. TaxID=2025608 RepID=UPI003BB603BD
MKPLRSSDQYSRAITPFWLEKRVILLLSITLLITVWIGLDHYYHKKAEENFEYIAHEHYEELNTRLHNYVHILRSGTGLFYSSDRVTREEWHRFVEVIDPKKHYPGLQGIGFSIMLKNGDEELLRKRLQADGFTPYSLENGLTLKSSILYLEPLDERNRNAIGYDMYSEPIRRDAMNRAAATGEMSMSAKVTLVQEIDENIQAGFLIYLPIFLTPEEPHSSKNLIGYVYSPIRAGDFFASIPTHHKSLRVDVYDNNQLLYQTASESSFDAQYYLTKTLQIGGRTWTIRYYSSNTFEKKYSSVLPIIFAIAIAFFNLILLYIIVELVRKRLELKKKNKEMEETKRWLKRLLNFSADGIHILDKNGKLILYSPSFQTMLGYNESEMESLDVFAWEVKIDPALIQVMMDNLTDNLTAFESIFCRKDGSMIDVEVKAHAFYEEGKKYIFASSWDITEQTRTKRELLSEKELAQHYLDIVEVMIIVISTDYTIQLINRKGSEILGYTPDEAVGKNFIDLFIPERMREQLQSIADGLLSFDAHEYYENPIITKNGVERLIAWRNRPMHDKNGMINAILSSGEDITDMRRAQEDLVERESFYKTIFASVSDAIVILENYFVMDCNEHALEIFETNLENFIGKYVFHIAYDIECQEHSFVEHANRAYDGYPSSTECSIRIHSYDSEPKIVELILTSFGKSQNNKLIMVVRDITHKIEEQRFLTMNARQAQMGEMISMIAHQWRQPLAIINS